MKLLIVDDSILSRLTLLDHFNGMHSVQIAEASNGVEALEQHRSFQPDIIFLDLTMPVLDGLSTLKILTKIDPRVKVIIVSSVGDQPSVQADAAKYGAFAIIAKPIDKVNALRLFHNAEKQLNAGDPP